MTPLTQSGFPVIPKYGDPRIVRTSPVNAAPGVLVGDVQTIFEWVMGRFDRTVAPLVPKQCWGYAPRKIRGGSGWSNHASATAIDLNATQFPQGRRYMSRAQVGACRQIVRQADGAIRWGGDYGGSTAVDQQHFEITSPSAARAFVAKLRAPKPIPPVQEDDMPTAKEVAEAMRPVIREEIEAALTGGVKVVWEDSRLRPTREREDSIVGALARAAVYSSNASGGVDQLARISGAEPEDRT